MPSFIYNINSKILCLGRQGKIHEARELFDKMPQRDSFSYSTMIGLYLKNNDFLKAETLFKSMPQKNNVAEAAMIDGYAKVGRMEEARKVFDYMSDKNVYAWNSLISGYFRIGRVYEAAKLFDQMPTKNVVSWTIFLMGFSRNGLIDQARDAFDHMPEKNVVAWTAMVKSYVENGQLDEARRIFDGMPQRNLYSWNIMLSAYLDNGKVTEAIGIFNLMADRNEVSWTSMVTGLAKNGWTRHARAYFDQMPKKDIAAWNAMITAYADDGLMVEARHLFNVMTERNTVTWNALIDGYAKNGPPNEALKHLILMRQFGVSPTETTLTSALTSCGGMLEIMQAHSLAINLGFDHEISFANALVTMYSKCGDISSACLTFENIYVKDVVSWTAMILAYANHGCGSHALHIFACMLKSGTRPDAITFVGVLSACAHAGLVKKGENIFDSMSRVYDVQPKAEHYACLIDILGRAGLVNKAAEVVLQMPSSERDGPVLGAVLGACKLHGDIELASHMGEKLIELESASSGSYVLLANIYAAGGKWEELAAVRKKMKEKMVKKVPGFSQIEVNGKTHMFLVGDRTHPEVDEIHKMLQETLLPSMQDMVGYEILCAFE
ncbi:Pentatricopeptide repeat [Dillenia turbinata]|uniref:Pentatricopeptide repeat n=1 Tax=Dillenia turbinata TaxID=194707 RepID=A0AAN8V936_9MAGN